MGRGPTLLLLLGFHCLLPPPAPLGAWVSVSAPVLGASATAHGPPTKAPPHDPVWGQAAPHRSAGAVTGLGLLGSQTRLSLRPRVGLDRGVILSGGRGLCFSHGPWPQARRPCLHVNVLLRAPRARRAAPTPVGLHLSAPRGRLSLQRRSPLRRSLGPLERTFPLGPASPLAASWASGRSHNSIPPRGSNPHTGFLARTKCPTARCRPAVPEAVNSDSARAAESSVSRQAGGDTCSLTGIKIQAEQKQAGVRPVFTRNTDIVLNASISYNCPRLQRIQTRWKVYLVPSQAASPDWSKPLYESRPSSGPDAQVLIPRGFLAEGLYVFQVSVYLIAPPKTLQDSKHIYGSVIRSPLQAVILGQPQVTVRMEEELVLDGSQSSDPDASNPQEGLRFFWYCSTNAGDYAGDTVNLVSKDVCLPEQADLSWPSGSGPVKRLPPWTLKGSQVYFFRLVVEKGGRTAFSDKTVNMLPGPTPIAKIWCTENCGRNLVISDRFSLSLKCTHCVANRDVYRWSILSAAGNEMVLDWAGQTSTGRDRDSVSVNAFAFESFPDSKFWMVLDIEAWGGVGLVLRHPFIINRAPEIGECKINPTSGIAFYTKFVVQCNDFKDQNVPLTYKMIVSDLYDLAEISSLKENTLGTILYMGNAPMSPPSFLPVGLLDNLYAMKVFVQVHDTLGAFSQVTVYATVRAPTDKSAPKTVMHQLLNVSMGQSSELSTLLQKQDFLPAGYLMYIVASVLNHLRPEAALEADKAALREHLLNQSFALPGSTLVGISQAVAAITKLTQVPSEFTLVAQKLATVRIWLANQALQQQQQKDTEFHSEQIEVVISGVLTSLSNILKMGPHFEVFDEPLYIIPSLADTVLAGKVPGNEITAMRTSSFNIYVRKTEKWAINEALGDETEPRNWLRPTLNASSAPSFSAKAPIFMMFCEFRGDPFPWLHSQENISADVVGFRMTGTLDTGGVLEITPDQVDVRLGRRGLSSAAFNLVVGPDDAPKGADSDALLRKTTGAFRFQVDSSVRTELLVHILTEVTVLFTMLVYAGDQATPAALVATFLVPHDIPPVANQSGLFDPACTVRAARVVCLPPALLQAAARHGCSSQCSLLVVLQAPRFVMRPTDKLVRVSLFSLRCLDMQGVQSDWREGVCVVGERTTWDRVHCVCGSARRARRQLDAIQLAKVRLHVRYFTARVIVVPNPVDLRLEVIKEVSQNPVTLLTVIFIMLAYLALAFWALHRDETDQFLRDHVIVLPDNDPYDNICYLVTIFTGSRWGSGTRANVFVQLTGTESASSVHCLSHPRFRTLYRGSINTFLLSTASDLGEVQAVRVWHDNEGKAPGWYLSRVKVENVFSRRIWLFMCRQWLSIDTSLDRTFRVTEPGDPLKRGDFFVIEVTHKLEKNHMWFSIFAGVVSKGFSRLQRLSCCLVMLLSFLLCNIMFFNLEADKEPEGSPYMRSVIIGLESAVITLPVQVAITGLFTYSQRTPQVTLEEVSPQKHPVMAEAGHWEERLEKWHAQETTSPELQRPPAEATPTAEKRFKKAAKQVSVTIVTRSNNAGGKDTNNSAGVPPAEPSAAAHTPSATEKPRVVLPRWCMFVAWFLVFATSVVSSFFIVFYGLTYGYERSIEWLFASFCSFCESIFVVQPSKIVFLSSVRTNRPKYCKNLSWVSNYRYAEIQLQGTRLRPDEMEQHHRRVLYLRGTRMYQPLAEDEIRIFKRKRHIRRQAWLFLTYVLMHFIFLALLLRLVALLRRPDSFYHNQFICSQFSKDLAKVTKLDDIYWWLNSVPLPLFHNDLNLTFLPDSSSQILGLPLVRQVRAKPGGKACLPVQSSVPNGLRGKVHCRPKYGTDPEDTRNYTGFWKKVDKRATGTNTQGFTYKPPEKRWAYSSYGLLHTYGSGGYAFYFFPDQQQFNSTLRLKDLQSSGWLDERTWAVILDLTVFSPDAGLLCSISVMFEVSQLGAVNTSISVHSFSLDDVHRETSAHIYLYAALLGFFLACLLHEGYVVLQERASYVTLAHNWLSCALLCTFATLLSLFLRKYTLAAGVTKFYSSNSMDFIPFQAVSQVDHVLGITLGFLIFLTILKSLGCFRFFYDVRLAQRAIHNALPGIYHAALMLFLCLSAYVAFGCLVFGQHEWRYSHLIHAAQMVSSYCIPAFQNTGVSTNRVLGALFLSSFILLVVGVLVNLFRAMILSTYKEMKQPVYEEPSEAAEAAAYLCSKLRTAVGFLTFQSKAPGEPKFFTNMVYGRPEKQSSRYLGLKTRNVKERKMVYLVV